MRNFIVRIFANAVSLWAAAEVLEGVHLTGDFADVLWVALVFGLVNAVLKPILMILSFPLLFVTLGLFTLVINAGLLLLTDRLTESFAVDGFVPALLGSILISIVSMVMAAILKDEKKD